MSITCPNSRSGYALLSFILITMTLLVMIIIPLYGLSLINVRSTITSQNTRQNFYVTESAIYDTVAKIANNNYLWPPAPPVVLTDYTLDVILNNITTQVIIDRDASFTYTIDAITNFKDTTRHLRASLSPASSGGTPSDVIIVMDTSGSMKYASSSPQEPLNTAVNAAIELIDKLENQTDNT